MIGAHRIEGYVIASADGMIADETGVMPPSLQHDADKRYFDDGPRACRGGRPRPPFAGDPGELAAPPAADPDPRASPASRAIRTTPTRGFWNPAGASFEEACAALGVGAGTIAVIGGPQVYSLFLKIGYDAFHLCRAVNVRLPGGLPVFVEDSIRRRARGRAQARRAESRADPAARPRRQPDGLDATLTSGRDPGFSRLLFAEFGASPPRPTRLKPAKAFQRVAAPKTVPFSTRGEIWAAPRGPTRTDQPISKTDHRLS